MSDLNMPEQSPAENTNEYLQALAAGWLPIREVSSQTGVNAVTLRAWERRYGLLKPHRTPKGHRLYDQQHVERVNQILIWINRGVAVSKVKKLLENREAPEVVEDGLWSEQSALMQQAIIQFDEVQLNEAFNRILSLYPARTLLERLLQPLLESLEQRWQGQLGSQIEQVFFHSWLQGKLAARIYLNNHQQAGRRLLMVNLGNSTMDAGLWLSAWLASSNQMLIDVFQWPVPLNELGLALDSMQPSALLLYASHTLDASDLQRNLPRLVSSSNLPVLLIGPAASIHRAELDEIPGLSLAATPFDTLSQLQALPSSEPQA